MHNQYKDQGFEILAFPSNEFFSTEPGDSKQIKSLVRNFYEGEFLLFEKSEVNGQNTNEVFKFCRSTCKELCPSTGSGKVKQIPWNFSKFLVDSEGKVVSFHGSMIAPIKLTHSIENMLTASE
eukprot:403332063